MYQCISNSKILKESLEFVSDDEYEIIIQNEFKNMCSRFCLTESEMIALIATHDISLLSTHYDTIWDSLNYYSMTCMDEYKNKYIESLFKTDLIDLRINSLCDDLQEYLEENSCINAHDKCDTLLHAFSRHHDNCVKYLLNYKLRDHYNRILNHSHVREAWDIIQYLFEQNNIYPKNLKKIINEKCYLNLIKYLLEEKKYECSISVLHFACEYGCLNIVKYLLEGTHIQCSSYAIQQASKNGHLDIIKYLFETHYDAYRKSIKNNTLIIDIACLNCHLDVIKYLFETHKLDCSIYAIGNACNNGDLDVVAYLFEIQNKDCTTDAIYNACRMGHLNVVKYLFEIQNKDCSTRAIDYACANGHLDVIAYLFEIQNKDCTNDGIYYANANRHSDVVKYLTEARHKKSQNQF